VFTALARRLFGSHEPDDPEIEQFGTMLVEIMGGAKSIPPQAAVGAIRAALTGDSYSSGLDAHSLMRLRVGFSNAALRQLELAPDEVAGLFVEAERHAAEAGVWLVPVEDEAEAVRGASLDSGRGSRCGPWDVAEVHDPRVGRVDFGSLLLHVPQGVDIRLIMPNDDEIVAVEMHAARTVLQLTAFAAPRGGMWDEVRHELAQDIARRSGTAREQGGTGVELWAQTKDRNIPFGEHGIRHARFLGADGPSWLLRGVLSWRGKPVEAEVSAFEDVFRDAVVVRGNADLADRTPLPLSAPQ
jgi:hypothetical protein